MLLAEIFLTLKFFKSRFLVSNFEEDLLKLASLASDLMVERVNFLEELGGAFVW